MSQCRFVVVVLLAASLTASASSSPSAAKSRILKTRGAVSGLYADGPRVAALTVGNGTSCDRIVVWYPARNGTSRVPTGIGCPNFDGSVQRILGFTLAGQRVAWIEGTGGNYFEVSLRSRVLGKKKSVTLAFTSNGTGAAEETDGGYIANAFGDGSLLVYDMWDVCVALPVGWEGEQTCPDRAPGDQPSLTLSHQQLLRVENAKSTEIASAPDLQTTGRNVMSLVVVAVDSGRIATQKPDGSVTIYAAASAVLQTIPVPTGKFAGVAMEGSQLAVLRDGDLELYDVSSGELVKTIPLPTGSQLRDLQGGLAVYVSGRKVHVLRLSDEKDVTYSPPGKGAVDTQIESSGLYYSYNFPGGLDHGRIALVPFAKVLAKLG